MKYTQVNKIKCAMYQNMAPKEEINVLNVYEKLKKQLQKQDYDGKSFIDLISANKTP